MKKAAKIFLFNVVLLALFLGGFEGCMAWKYTHPGENQATLCAAQKYYNAYEAKIIQYLPECAEYNPTTSYRLKPGTFHFACREFDNEFRVNDVGLRDDAESLDGPEIIVCGDSYTMGWGVDQEECFPQLIEKKLGRKTLNAGISSFGTARELILLSELDQSKMKYLIIQYSPNDRRENSRMNQDRDAPLQISPKRSYVLTRHALMQNIEYYPGKYSRIFFPLLVAEHKALAETGTVKADGLKKALQLDAMEHASLFVRMLAAPHWDLSKYKIIAFSIDAHNHNNPYFPEAVKTYQQKEDAEPALKALDLTMLDLSGRLHDGDYLVYDDHMRASGHKVVADAIIEAIQEMEQSANLPPAP